jgi:glutathione S-transferase
MKLYYSKTSPYARKVRLVIHEKGLQEQVEGILVSPFDDYLELRKFNPLGKIPTLLLDDGEVLFDSPVICHYLDSISASVSLIPDDNRWNILRWEALADGMTDSLYNLVMERRRPAEEQSSSWIAHWAGDVQRCLQEAERRLGELDNEVTLAHLALGAAVGYVDFRAPELLYENDCPQVAYCPKLLTWYERFGTRSSMLATKPE